MVSCHACDQVCRLEALPPAGHALCPRCGATLHRRKPDSLARTWALVIAACILYIPANLLPVMTVISFGKGEPDTILSGVKALIELGMWPVVLEPVAPGEGLEGEVAALSRAVGELSRELADTLKNAPHPRL